MARKKAEKTPEVEAVTTPVVEQPQVAPKAKKSVAPFVLIGVVAVFLIAGIVAKIIISSPKQVFTSYINHAYKEVSNTLKEIEDIYDPSKEAIEISATLKIDTNMDSEEFIDAEGVDIKNLTFDVSAGVDIPHEEVFISGGVKGKKERIGGKIYLTDGKEYLQTTFYDEIIEIGEELGLEDLTEYFDEVAETDVSLSLYDDILGAFTKALTDSLDKDAMSKESDEIEVLGKELKVTKNSYKITEKSAQKLVKGTAENLLDNKEFIKNLAKATGVDKDDIKEGLKTLKEEAKDISFDTKITINIYTDGILNKFTGIDIYVEKDKIMSWYQNGENIEAKIDTVKFTVEKEKKEKTFKLTDDGEKIATGTIREYSKEKIDLDFVIYDGGEEEIKGSIYFTRKDKKKTISGEYKYRMEYEKEYVEFSGEYTIETKDKLDGFKTSGAVDADEIDVEEFIDALKKAAEDDDDLGTIVNDLVEGYEEEQLESKLNYYNMYTTTAKEAVELLDNNKATVLYVGYSYYSADDPYYMFANLRSVQYDLDFNSYMLDSSNVTADFENAVADVEFTCTVSNATSEEEQKCSDWPAIFIIKGGEVKYAFRGTVTEETLTAALKDVGI